MATDGSRWPAWESAATRRPRLSLERHVVLLAVVGGDRLDGDLPADHGPEALDGVGPLRLQIARRVRVDADQHLLPGSFLGTGLNLAEDLRGQGRIGLHDAAALAGGARRAEERLQALAHALARHLDQSQLGDLEHVGAGLVLREYPRQGLEDLVAVLGALHVYEVDDDDPAQVSQSDLADDLGHLFQVDLEHGLLEVPLTHVLAGVDVDGHQGLGVVDDDVAARLEPDAAPLRHVDDGAAGQRDEGGDAGALGAARFLGHLDQDLLALVEELLDWQRRCERARLWRGLRRFHVGGVLVAVVPEIAVVLAEVGRVVAAVEEGVLLEPDVHEGCLHAGQDVGDHALVDVADDGAAAFPLHVEFGQEIPVLDGESRLDYAGINDDPLDR